MVSNKNVSLDKQTNNLFEKIAELIEQVRTKVVTAVNTAEVYTKFRKKNRKQCLRFSEIRKMLW